MIKKFYAVKKGRKPGIYYSWEDCKVQVLNFPEAIYKSFQTQDEAMNYLTSSSNMLQSSDSLQSDINTSDKAIAYIDGSFDEKTNRFAYGCIIFYKNQKYEFNKAFSDESLVEMRNVAGEIAGASVAMNFCIKNNIPNLDLYYDYSGIEQWCTLSWKAKKTGSQRYRDFYITKIKPFVNITFYKVKGHSGIKYNEEVDILAKKALDLI